MQVTIFTANCIGQAANCSYPNKVTVVTPEQLREAVKADHVCGQSTKEIIEVLVISFVRM